MPSRPNAPVQVAGYEQFSEIGRGGTAVVYSAVQQPMGRTVAVKVLKADLADDIARSRFRRECNAVGALGDAPGIVPVYAATFTADGRGCIVMRRMRESLADVLRRDGPLSAERAREVGVVAAAALQHAHERGVVHRDVKPANLLVSDFDEIALGDFDISSVGAVGWSTLTSGAMSPPHAPPERLSGDDRPGPAGDIWSLGSTLFTLLDGAPPFGSPRTEGGMAGLVDRVLHHPAPRIGAPDMPVELERVILRALAKDPADRWPDADAFRDALDALVLDDPPVSAPFRVAIPTAIRSDRDTEPGERREIPRPGQRRDLPWTTFVVVAATAIAVGAAALMGLR